jgi:hypothetical protein
MIVQELGDRVRVSFFNRFRTILLTGTKQGERAKSPLEHHGKYSHRLLLR